MFLPPPNLDKKEGSKLGKIVLDMMTASEQVRTSAAK